MLDRSLVYLYVLGFWAAINIPRVVFFPHMVHIYRSMRPCCNRGRGVVQWVGLYVASVEISVLGDEQRLKGEIKQQTHATV